MEMNKMEKMDKIWKILMDTRIEIIKARFKYSEYAETYALNYDEAFNHYVLYVQSNLTYWRGETARAVKLDLKNAVKLMESVQ